MAARIALSNFGTIAQNLHEAADGLTRCQNLPAARDAATLQTLVQQLGDIQTTVAAGFRKQDTRLFNLSTRLANNGVARTAEQELAPFRSLNTHEIIANFPATANEIDNLDRPVLMDLLRQLDLPSIGNLVQVRARFKREIGLQSVTIRGA